MSQIWAVLVFLVLVLIVYGIVSGKVRSRRLKRLTHSFLPEVDDFLRTDRTYTIVLNSGVKFEGVKILGLTKASDDPTDILAFPLQRLLVIGLSDGKRAFIKPESVRYYREL